MSEDKNIVPVELLKLRNNLAKKFTNLQGKSIHEYKTADGIIKRMDALFSLQEAIKKLDILIPFTMKPHAAWRSLSLFVDIEDEEKWKPGIKKIGDFE